MTQSPSFQGKRAKDSNMIERRCLPRSVASKSSAVSGFHVPSEFGVDDLTEVFGSRFSGMDIPVLRFSTRRAPGGVIAQRPDLSGKRIAFYYPVMLRQKHSSEGAEIALASHPWPASVQPDWPKSLPMWRLISRLKRRTNTHRRLGALPRPARMPPCLSSNSTTAVLPMATCPCSMQRRSSLMPANVSR